MGDQNDLAVLLKIMADSSQLQAELMKVVGILKEAGNAGGPGGRVFSGAEASSESFQQSLKGLIGRFSVLWLSMQGIRQLGQLAFLGTNFLAELETARVGIGALITAEAKLYDGQGRELKGREALNAAMVMADEQIRKLRISGMETAATTDQLVAAYQSAMGAGLSAGLTLDQIRKLTVETVQAAGAMHIPMSQLNQQIRSILSGQITRNAKVAKALQITSEDVAKWRAQGTLFQELDKRMQSFAEAGKEASNTWNVMLTNVREASLIFLGEAFKAPFAEMKQALKEVLDAIVDVKNASLQGGMADLLQMGKDFAGYFGTIVVGAIKLTVQTLKDLGAWWGKNRTEMRAVIADAGALVGAGFEVVWETIKLGLGLLSALLGWFGGLSDTGKSLVTVLIAVAAAQMLLNNAEQVAAKITILTKALALLRTVALTGMIGGPGAVLTGLAQGLGGLVSPALLAVAAIVAVAVGLSSWAQSYSKAAAEKAEADQEMVKHGEQNLTTFRNLTGEMNANVKAVERTAVGSKKHADALKELGSTVNKMVAEYPAFLNFLHKENGEYVDLAGSVERFQKSQLNLLKLKLETEQTDAREAKRQRDDANSRNVVSYGLVYKGIAENAEREQHAHEASAESLKKQIAMLEQFGKEGVSGAGVTVVGNPREASEQEKNKALEHEKELREANLVVEEAHNKALERGTLEQQKQVALDKVQLDIQQERTRVENMKTLSADEKAPALAAITAEGKKRELEVTQEWDAKIAQAEVDFNTKMGIITETGWAKKEAQIRADFARELALRERQTGQKIADEDKELALERRIEAEHAQFMIAEKNRLKAEVDRINKESNESMALEDQIEWLRKFGTANGYSAEAVRNLTDTLEDQMRARDNWLGGWKAGFRQWLNDARNTFNNFKKAADTVMKGVSSAFAKGISGLISGQMTLKQAMKSIWQGITDAVVSAIADLIAQWLVAKAAAILFGKSQSQASGARVAASLTSATAETWEAYAGIPFVGPALAAAQTALMFAEFGAAAAGATAAGAAVATKNAEGGFYTKPTFGLFGEAGDELVAPAVKFTDWTKRVGAEVQGSLMAVGMQQMAQAARNHEVPHHAIKEGDHIYQIDMKHAKVYDTGRRGAKKFGDMVLHGISETVKVRKSRIRPGEVTGGN